MIDGAAIITHIDEVEKRLNERFTGLDNRIDIVIRTTVTKEECQECRNGPRNAIVGFVLKNGLSILSVSAPTAIIVAFWQDLTRWIGGMVK